MTAILTPSDEAQIARILQARDSLLDFTQYTFPTYERTAHLKRLAEELEAVERGETLRLMIFMPPQHGKSELVSVRFPAWILCRHPATRYIMASYGESLAADFGGQVRNIVAEQPLFPNVRLASDTKAKDLWKTEAGGFLRAVGIGSGVIGRGADIISIDDPYKKRQEAYSETYREQIRGWYRTEIYTRRQPKTAIILILHRWHEDDLAGTLLQEAKDDPLADQWRVLSLPAVAERGDALGREEGDPLWPSKFTAEFLAQQERGMFVPEWNALYQQRPGPEEGSIFKWWPRYEKLPDKLQQIVVPIDTAYTDTSGSDYTAWATWGHDGTRAYLMNAERFRGESPEAERHLTGAIWRIKQQNPTIPVRPLVRQKIAADRIVGQHMKEGITTVGEYGKLQRQAGLPVVFVKMPSAGKDWKQVMAKVVVPEFESGRALIPEWAPWLDDWLEEHKGFPTATHDDWVETTIIGLYHLFRREPVRLSSEPVRVYADY